MDLSEVACFSTSSYVMFSINDLEARKPYFSQFFYETLIFVCLLISVAPPTNLLSICQPLDSQLNSNYVFQRATHLFCNVSTVYTIYYVQYCVFICVEIDRAGELDSCEAISPFIHRIIDFHGYFKHEVLSSSQATLL